MSWRQEALYSTAPRSAGRRRELAMHKTERPRPTHAGAGAPRRRVRGHMNAMREWLRRHGATLTPVAKGADEVEFDLDAGPKEEGPRAEVRINGRAPYRSRVLALMHECGHVVIFLRRARRRRKRYCGLSYREWAAADAATLRTKWYKIAVLQEEIEAWSLGEALARKLGVSFSARQLHRHRTRCLMSYVRYCARECARGGPPRVRARWGCTSNPSPRRSFSK